MVRFSSPQKQGTKQAANVMKSLQGNKIASVGTVRNYEQALKNVATTLAQQKENLKDLTPETAKHYLDIRAEEVGQKTLDMERQAIQIMMQHVTGKLDPSERLNVIKSEHQSILKSRAYTPEQITAIAANMRPQNALATEISYASGLRAHELFTLRPVSEQPADIRPTLDEKFTFREGDRYTVTGKGGLIREVLIPHDLAKRLEDRRLEIPKNLTDRNIHYTKNYDIQGGHNWSSSFTRSSNRVLGWSHGAHGLRHSYAQERMEEIRSHGYERDYSLQIVSQEMGHFRPDITEVYLR